MRPSSTIAAQSLALLGLLAGQTLAACPYAEQLAARSEMNSGTMNEARHKELGKKAEGKKGVFFL